MLSKIKIVFITLVTISLNSCGYTPIYKMENKEALLEFYAISISEASNAIDKEIRESLLNKIRIDRSIPIKYTLDIKANSISEGIVTNINTRISRYEVEVTAKYSLYKVYKSKKRKMLLSSTISRRASYRVLPNNITATIASEDSATSKSVQSIVNDIYDQLLLTIIAKNG